MRQKRMAVGTTLLVLTIFSGINAAGQRLDVLHPFQNSDGASPFGPLLQGSDGSYYGTTHGVDHF